MENQTKNVTIDELKRIVDKKKVKMSDHELESYRIGNIYVNLAFILMEGCEVLLRDANQKLTQCGQCQGIRYDVRRDFNMMKEQLKNAQVRMKEFARIVHRLEDADSACEDSDEIMEMVMLYIDRAGEDRELGLKIRSMVKNSYPSKLRLNV